MADKKPTILAPAGGHSSRGRLLNIFYSLFFVSAAVLTVNAQIVTPFTTRFTQNARGNFVITGNNLLTCPSSDSDCDPNGNDDDNDFNMVYIDVDANPTTFNSSRAVVNLPAGATVLFAGLYWGADTDDGSDEGPGPNPEDAPNPNLRRQVLFDTPALGGYSLVEGSQIGISGTRYHCFFDATGAVRAAGNGTYTVANLQAGTGGDRYGGWSLVVVYRLPIESLRNLTVFDGYALVTDGDSVTINVSGFVTPAAGPVNTLGGVVAYEGDRSLDGDSFSLNGNVLSNALNPSDNFFNSSITRFGVAVGGADRTPNDSNLFGFDVDVGDATGTIPNNATSATLRLTTDFETYFPGVVVFATELFLPNIPAVKTATDLNGGTLIPGDVIEYSIPFTNAGNDGAQSIVFSDLIPSNTTYVPGSLVVTSGANAGAKTDANGDDQAEFQVLPSPRVIFRPGTGATGSTTGTLAVGESTGFSFRVTVNPGTTGQTIINQPSLTEVGVTSLATVNENIPPSIVTVAAPTGDLSITKTDNVATASIGQVLTYTVVATNNGPDAVVGAVIDDNAPPSLANVTWTCVPSAGSSCAIGSGTGNITNTVDLLPGGTATITATATVVVTTGTFVFNLASIKQPVGFVDANTSNNFGIDIDQLVAPTAAEVSVAGRVMTSQGFGISSARVTITDSSGTTQTAITNPFGFYRFDAIGVGQTYVVSVGHKRYSFTPRIVTVDDELLDVNFIADVGGKFKIRDR
jgi:uncharacterized repeat protein (TIGR01451 family)